MDNNRQDVVFRESLVTHSGPLPPANEFALYEQSLPGTAERILSMAENETAHRHKREMRELDDVRLGQYFGFIITLLSFAVFGALVYIDKPLESLVPAAFAFVNLVAVFLGQKSGRANKYDK